MAPMAGEANDVQLFVLLFAGGALMGLWNGENICRGPNHHQVQSLVPVY